MFFVNISNMNAIVITCTIAVSLSFVLLCAYAIIPLIQLTKTAKEAEETAKKLNCELDAVNSISQSIISAGKKISAPLISAGSLAAYLLKAFLKNKNKQDRY